MKVQELIELVKRVEVTDEEIEALNIRLAEAEEKFKEEDLRRRPDAAWCNRTYTL